MNIWIKLIIELVVLCGVFWLLCYLGVGDDKKNIKSFASYPDEVQKRVKENKDLEPLVKIAPKWYITFISNILIFTILLFIFAVFIRQDSYWFNFLLVTILGQGLNAFDFLVMDLLWWRNSPKIRFSAVPDAQLYKPIKKHFQAFLRGVVCFVIVAFIVAGIITAF